jgi:hypothetical protein
LPADRAFGKRQLFRRAGKVTVPGGSLKSLQRGAAGEFFRTMPPLLDFINDKMSLSGEIISFQSAQYQRSMIKRQ